MEAATPPGVTMQQLALGGKMLGDDGQPPELELAGTAVVRAEHQQEPSPPMTSAEAFPLLLDEPDVVDGGVVSGVAVRRETIVTEEFGGPGWFGVLNAAAARSSTTAAPV